jgi:hypothetical protein
MRFAFDGDGHGGWGIVGISDERRTHARVCMCGKVEWVRVCGAPRALVQGTKPRPVPVLYLSDAGRLGTLAVRWRRGGVVRTVLLDFLFLSCTLATYGYGYG